jgi:hypothetical protein
VTNDKPKNGHRNETIHSLPLVLNLLNVYGENVEMNPNEAAVECPNEGPSQGIEKGDSNAIIMDQQCLIRDFQNEAFGAISESCAGGTYRYR